MGENNRITASDSQNIWLRKKCDFKHEGICKSSIDKKIIVMLLFVLMKV